MVAARGPRRPFRLVPALVALGTVALLIGGALAGLRAFVVESPSMGESAPVGTLVVGTTRVGPLRVGQVVTYRPPAGGQSFTHRVVSVVPGGVRVRGDINGSDDPWVVTPAMVESRALLLVPGAGWLIRSLPFLVCGYLVQRVVGLLVPAALRTELRLVVGALTLAVVSTLLRPFTGFVLLQTTTGAEGVRAEMVSTALLPIRLLAEGGGGTSLVPGEVGHLLLPAGAGGRVAVTSQLALDAPGWAVVIAVSLLPVAAAVAASLRRPGEAPA